MQCNQAQRNLGSWEVVALQFKNLFNADFLFFNDSFDHQKYAKSSPNLHEIAFQRA
jgi:hypothetical protein